MQAPALSYAHFKSHQTEPNQVNNNFDDDDDDDYGDDDDDDDSTQKIDFIVDVFKVDKKESFYSSVLKHFFEFTSSPFKRPFLDILMFMRACMCIAYRMRKREKLILKADYQHNRKRQNDQTHSQETSLHKIFRFFLALCAALASHFEPLRWTTIPKCGLATEMVVTNQSFDQLLSKFGNKSQRVSKWVNGWTVLVVVLII